MAARGAVAGVAVAAVVVVFTLLTSDGGSEGRDARLARAEGASEAVDDKIPTADPARPASVSSPERALSAFLADDQVSVVAHATRPLVAVHAAADAASEVTHRMENPTSVGGPLVFLVREVDGEHLLVDLPVRPNGSQGWIHRDDVRLVSHTYRIVVDVTERTFRLYHDGDLETESAVAVGATDTPTPGGTFYVKELLQPPTPDTVYGPYAFGLSGFSNTLRSFAGGEGVIGIHGTDDPDAIGNEVSHGCIRLPNDEITKLVGLLPLGTPVEIVG